MELGKRDVERIVAEYLEAFEEAIHEPVELQEPTLTTILLALDRSNQDEQVIRLGSELARRHGADLVLTIGLRDERREEGMKYLAEVSARLSQEGLRSKAEWGAGAESFEKILSVIQSSRSNLVILPAPYLRDMESLGEDSVGTNLDVLLVRSPVPLLVARHPDVDALQALRSVFLAVFDGSELSRSAAEWALLLAKGGRLSVLGLVEEEVVERMEEALEPEAPSEEVLSRRLAREMVPLISGVLRRCDEMDISCEGEYVTGDVVRTILRSARRPSLIVLRGYEVRDGPAEKVAREVIPRSRFPVLVVRGERAAEGR